MNTTLSTLLVTFALAVLAYAWFTRRRHREHLLRAPFPDEWRAIAAQVPLYRRIPANLLPSVEHAARRLIAQTGFIGCNGLTVTDEMRVTVAVQAALLVAFRDVRAFERLHSVLMYPSEFVVQEREEDEFGLVTEGSRALSGQTVDLSQIVLSWEDVERSRAEPDGYNVVLHEFAHHLDHLFDGTLSGERAPSSFNEAYEALCEQLDRGEETLLDPYGAEDPVEFFAVATETFYELPQEMRAHHPALYAALADLYGADPAAWD